MREKKPNHVRECWTVGVRVKLMEVCSKREDLKRPPIHHTHTSSKHDIGYIKTLIIWVVLLVWFMKEHAIMRVVFAKVV